MRVCVRDLMSRDQVILNQEVSISDAISTVLDQALGEVFVADDSGKLLGIVTDTSLLKSKLMRNDSSKPIGTIMSRSLLVMGPDANIDDVVGVFRDSCHSKIAVVENGHLVGLLHRRDVLRTLLFLEQIRETSESIRRIEPGTSDISRPVFLYEDGNAVETLPITAAQ